MGSDEFDKRICDFDKIHKAAWDILELAHYIEATSDSLRRVGLNIHKELDDISVELREKSDIINESASNILTREVRESQERLGEVTMLVLSGIMEKGKT